MLFIHTRSAEELRIVAERLPAPLMMFAPPDGFADFPITPRELFDMGYRFAASSGTAFAAMHKAIKQSYEHLAKGTLDPFLGKGGAEREMKIAHQTCDLATMVEIERRTMQGR
jgi:2-methylisocitrate lyase-like PEP mutase family enzyme